MVTCLITGSAGLIGAEAARLFSSRGYRVLGIDNNMRRQLFGEDASTERSHKELVETLASYSHHDIDIRDRAAISRLFADYSSDIAAIIHTAAQPSHDWAAKDPQIDFEINAVGTLNLLEAMRTYAPRASFIFTSTNKVYGDRPNQLPLVEADSRWELDSTHPYFEHGIDEQMSVDHTTHSFYGAGIRPLLWMQHRVLPRRMCDWSGTPRNRDARLPVVSGSMRDHRKDL
jgi:CDP-paratose 2-epimerase